jgi:hypothetical protein
MVGAEDGGAYRWLTRNMSENNAALVGQNLIELVHGGAIDPSGRIWPELSRASRILSDARVAKSPEVRLVEMARAVESLVGTSDPWRQVTDLYLHAVPIWHEVGKLLDDVRDVVHWIGVLGRHSGALSGDAIPPTVSHVTQQVHVCDLLGILSDCREAARCLPIDYLLRYRTEQRIVAMTDPDGFLSRLDLVGQQQKATIDRIKRHRNAAVHGRRISRRLLELSARSCLALANLVTEIAFQASQRDVSVATVMGEKISRSRTVRADIGSGGMPADILQSYYATTA